jgi:hypothetical protein
VCTLFSNRATIRVCRRCSLSPPSSIRFTYRITQHFERESNLACDYERFFEKIVKILSPTHSRSQLVAFSSICNRICDKFMKLLSPCNTEIADQGQTTHRARDYVKVDSGGCKDAINPSPVGIWMHLRDCNQCFMPFAEAACRVGVRSVGSQLERLTPASSEVSSLRSQLLHGSFIQASPRKRLKANEWRHIQSRL